MNSPTNFERSERAEKVLFYYDDLASNDVPSIDTVTDLLTDLMHYCSQNQTEMSFDDCLIYARRHFQAEEEAE